MPQDAFQFLKFSLISFYQKFNFLDNFNKLKSSDSVIQFMSTWYTYSLMVVISSATLRGCNIPSRFCIKTVIKIIALKFHRHKYYVGYVFSHGAKVLSSIFSSKADGWILLFYYLIPSVSVIND